MRTHLPFPIIFTDLDGTLLDHDSYDCHAALAALDAVRTRGVPLVFCSSKTRAEQLALRDRLCVFHPFIVEDGSAVYVDAGYFPFEFVCDRTDDGLLAIRLSPGYERIRAAIRDVERETGATLRGYGDLPTEEVAALTGLSLEDARRAKTREFQETIVSPLALGEADAVSAALASRDMKLTRGGRFFGVSGRSDKGAAALILAELYRRRHGDVELVGIGDSFNDRALLAAVDVPALVQKKDQTWEDIEVPNLVRVEGAGPEGWNRFVTGYLANGD